MTSTISNLERKRSFFVNGKKLLRFLVRKNKDFFVLSSFKNVYNLCQFSPPENHFSKYYTKNAIKTFLILRTKLFQLSFSADYCDINFESFFRPFTMKMCVHIYPMVSIQKTYKKKLVLKNFPLFCIFFGKTFWI